MPTGETAARPIRVLVVEDEPIIALNMQTILLDLGYRPVGPANTINEAMAVIEQRRFDAAILDVSLPDGESFGLANLLIERKIPFFFVTGRYLDALHGPLAEVPVISKPFDIATIENSLAALRDRIQAGDTRSSPAA